MVMVMVMVKDCPVGAQGDLEVEMSAGAKDGDGWRAR